MHFSGGLNNSLLVYAGLSKAASFPPLAESATNLIVDPQVSERLP